MHIDVRFIKKSICVYLTLPFLLFLGGWVRPVFSVPAIGFIVWAVYAGIFKTVGKENENDFVLSGKTIAPVVLFALIWGYLAGQGGFFYQSPDYHYRNAIFRDLIFYDWPVLYPIQKSAMVYYLGHWLVPALTAKLFLISGVHPMTVWHIGNIALLLWGAAGVSLLTLLMMHTLQANTPAKKTTCLLMLLLFSGMDAVGAFLFRDGLALHIEWWAESYQYSSLTTCMFWVFNQTIEPWLIMMLLFSRPKVGDFAFLGLMCLFFAPFPFIGLLPYFFAIASVYLYRAYRDKTLKTAFLSFFTKQNVVACLVVFPLSYLYYSANNAISDSGDNAFITFRFLIDPTYFQAYDLIKLACFFLLEFGLLCLILYPDEKRNLFFKVTFFSLSVIPFIQVGFSGDFVMRSSIPALFALMLITTRRLFETPSESMKFALISLCLGFGAITPAIEFIRAGREVILAKEINIPADNIKSLGFHIGKKDLRNFVRLNADETVFFKYVSRLPD